MGVPRNKIELSTVCKLKKGHCVRANLESMGYYSSKKKAIFLTDMPVPCTMPVDPRHECRGQALRVIPGLGAERCGLGCGVACVSVVVSNSDCWNGMLRPSHREAA